jgi:hypothetical protein
MKKLIAAITILASAMTFSSASHAWGEHEQGLLTGAAVVLLGSKILSSSRQQQPQQVIVIQDSELADAYLKGLRDGQEARINAEVEQILARERRMKYRIYACGVSVHNCDRVTSIH